MKYIATSFIITDTPDNYKNGESIDCSDVFEVSSPFAADTIPELINKIGKTYLDDTNIEDFIKCAIVMDNSVSMKGMVDQEGDACISSNEWIDWKAGIIDLFAREIRFDIAVKMSHDELVNAGIEDYD